MERFAAGRLIWLACLCAAAACQSRGQLLNSERIEAAFGSYGIEVLESDAVLRISNLYSVDAGSGERTTRTLAVVRYPTEVSPAFAREHRQILDGGSIGATFQAAGWTVVKTHVYFGERPSSGRLEALMRLDRPGPLAVHGYVLEVVRDDQRLRYAMILEVHHPAYLSGNEVRRIYAPRWVDGDGEDGDIASLSAVLVERGY